MSVWDDYVEWSGLNESMLAHPAGKGIPVSSEVAAMIAAAQDEQAVELANRDLADAELHAGGRLRLLDERHHELSTRGGWLDVAGPAGIVLVFFLVVFAFAVLAGGWPA